MESSRPARPRRRLRRGGWVRGVALVYVESARGISTLVLLFWMAYALPILIGVGIDFAIQVHNRVEEEVVLDHDQHPMGETLANLAPPLIAADQPFTASTLVFTVSTPHAVGM